MGVSRPPSLLFRWSQSRKRRCVMLRAVLLSLLIVPSVWGASIVEFPMDALRVIDLPVSREVTTITLPGAITAVVGADMLIDDGKGGADVDEGASLRFHVTH